MNKQARIRTQEMRKAQAEQARRDAHRRRIVMIVGGLVVLGLVVAIVLAVVNATKGDDSPTASGDATAPANVTADGSVPVGQTDAPVTVAIYFDYMCPACGAFEKANGDELDRLVEEGTAELELRPISFLDQTSRGTKYSTRAANAFATVADAAPEDAWEFHRALYASQPLEGTEGLTDDQIADIALEAGVPQAVVDRFGDLEFEDWVAQVTQEAFDSGVEGTPTVLIDGETFEGDLYTPGVVIDAIESAAQ